MKTAAIIVETDAGERLAAYRGLPLEHVAKAVGFLDLMFSAFRTAGEVKRQVEAVAGAVVGAPAKRQTRGKR